MSAVFCWAIALQMLCLRTVLAKQWPVPQEHFGHSAAHLGLRRSEREVYARIGFHG